MTPSTKKQFNTAVGGVFFAIGSLAWLIAVVFALKPSDKVRLPPVSLAPSVEARSCQATINGLYGFTTRMAPGGNVVVTTQDLSDPHKVLNDATGALAICKMELIDFCMGSSCQESGMTMTMGQTENQRHVVTGRAQNEGSAGSAVRPSAAPAKKQ